MQNKMRSPAVIFLIYLFVGLLLFGKGYNGELVDDGLAGLVKFENMGWRGFWQSFGFPSLYYCHDFFVLTVYKVVGKSPLGWFIVMIFLHSLNASLCFVLFRKLYFILGINMGNHIAFSGSALFLLSPYQTENILWAATLHYSISLFVFLVSSIILLRDFESGIIAWLTAAIILILYCIALLTLEISLIFPLAYLVIGCGIIFGGRTTVAYRQFLIKLIFPLSALIVIYFLLTRTLKGHWLPHYGETHLLNNNIAVFASTYACYVIKLLGYIHFAQYGTRDLVYTFCQKWYIIFPLEILISSGVFYFFKTKKNRNTGIAFAILTILTVVLILPSLNMYFMYLFNTQNDRLGYFFSLAFYQVLAFVIISFFSYIGMIFLFFYGITGIYFLHQQVGKWRFAGVIQDKFVQSFIWLTAPKIFVLNDISFFNGVYVFRNDGRLLYALDLFKKYKDNGRVVQIYSACATDSEDSTRVEVLNDSTLHIEAVTGGWLMHESLGAGNYRTKDFYTEVDKWGPGYKVIFRCREPGTIYIYSTPSGFRQLENF